MRPYPSRHPSQAGASLSTLSMMPPAEARCELPRIPIPRTRVNKGMKSGLRVCCPGERARGAYRSGWKNENDHGGAAFLEAEVEFMLTQIAIVLAAQTKERVLSPEVLIAVIGVFGTLAAALIISWLTSRSSLKR